MNTKRIVLSLAIVSFAVLANCVCWYVDYRLNLAPRFLFSISFEDAKHFCPDLVVWRDGANPWEFVPNDVRGEWS
ncbi:MAG: hypothetical protein IKR48_09870 [Kiritimatiellae bacterium]|nr:hypothetical protein [Kiritimatiellia bacterium]